MKRFLVALFLVVCLTSGARAYTPITAFNGQTPTWGTMPIPFWINSSGSSAITNGSDFAAVQAAFQTWQNNPLAAVSFQYMGSTPVTTVGQDGINLVTFIDSSVPLGSDVAATTFVFENVDATGYLTIQEADIAVSPTAVVSTSGDPAAYDIQGLLTHEIGHFIGLNHSGLMSSVMSPVGAPPMVDERTLTFDDEASAAQFYAAPNLYASFGGVSGQVLAGPTPVFGAHVVAIDANGTAVASSLTYTDGSFYIEPLPPGSYRFYAEPLDGPLYPSDVGGNPSSYYNNLGTGFGTTYITNVLNLSQAAITAVVADQLSQNINISVLPATTLNITEPRGSVPRIPLGGQLTLDAGGVTLVSGDVFSLSNTTALNISSPAYGGSIASDAPSSAQIVVAASVSAALGPKNVAVTRSSATSILSGGVVIVNPQPSGIQVAPASGPTDGGTSTTISGQNFRLGASVYFNGLASSSVQWLNATTIQAVAPPNSPGAASVMVVNNDGTWGVQAAAFTYNQQPPQITGVSPSSGAAATTVTISGQEFDSRPGNLTVNFNGTPATIIGSSRTQISAIVPYRATTGPVTVTAFGETGTGPTFTVTAPVSSLNLPPSADPPFIDASPSGGGTALNFGNADDASAIVQLPFPFSFFSKTYAAGTSIAVSTNGWISLDAFSRPEYQNGQLPGVTVQRPDGSTGSIPPALIAPFFSNLFIQEAGSINTLTLGTAPNRQFVVEWSDMGIEDSNFNDVGASVTFEAILYEGSNDIQFLYQSLSGSLSNGSTATVGLQDSTQTKAVQSSYDQGILSSGLSIPYYFTNNTYVSAPPGLSNLTYSIGDKGGTSRATTDAGSAITVGYATIQPTAGNTTPSGVAIFGFTESNVLVSEAGVPAAPLMTGGRLYAQVNGTVDTGLAIANPNGQAANVSFFFTDTTGKTFGSSSTTIPANGQIAKFLDQAPFNGGSSVQGTFTFSSSVPVAVVALRGLTNQRGEFLITTLPIADTSAAITTSTQVLPHFADGGGWTTQVVLVNPGNAAMSGNIQFLTTAGLPNSLTANSQTASTFAYMIPPQSSFDLQTAGAGSAVQSGSVQIVPGTGNGAPVPLSIFSYKPAGITVSEAGVPSVSGATFRMYAEASGVPGTIGSIETGLAIANTSSSPATVAFDLTDLNGQELGLTTTLTIPANGQVAKFLAEVYAGQTLPLPLKGILRISSSGPGLSVVGLRGRYNQRDEFLITTTPASNEAATATSAEMVFPQVVDGGGYTTQFVLFSGTAYQAVSGTLVFVNQNGTPLSLNFQ